VHILGKLDLGNKLWETIQRKKAVEGTEEAYKIGDKEKRNERLTEISDIFQQNSDDYGRKLFLIENCIYGIDIQPIAIQISKLRFFISLIVNQEKSKNKDDNYGIRPLPNLETKFVAANTLIGIKRESDVLADPEIENVQKQLLGIRHQHFNARNAKEKIELRKEDRRLAHELAKILKNDGFYNSHDAEQMAKWNPYDQNTPSDFFDPEWMFGVSDGFDVVIGNPPYVDSEHMVASDNANRKTYTEIYKSTVGNWDLFIPFIEKGMNLASGFLSLIIPNKLISQDYALTIREMLMEKDILEVRDYSRLGVFENADVYPITILVSKKIERIQTKFTVMKTISDISRINILKNSMLHYLSWDSFFWDSDMLSLLLKIFEKQNRMKGYLTLTSPCTVSEAYLIKKSLSDKNDAKGNKLINSGTIDKYVSLWGIKRTNYIKNQYIHPVISDRDLKKVSDRRLSQSHSHKIIVANMTTDIEAYYDSKGEYLAGKSTVIGLGNDEKLKMTLALLNSKLISFWYKSTYHSSKMSGEALSVTADKLGGIPMPEITSSNEKSIIALVDQILAAKAANPQKDTSGLETQIDKMVYKLYGLKPQEIEVVEGKGHV
jgi:hypothetical protein